MKICIDTKYALGDIVDYTDEEGITEKIRIYAISWFATANGHHIFTYRGLTEQGTKRYIKTPLDKLGVTDNTEHKTWFQRLLRK